jgi:hypothetical protein
MIWGQLAKAKAKAKARRKEGRMKKEQLKEWLTRGTPPPPELTKAEDHLNWGLDMNNPHPGELLRNHWTLCLNLN